MEEPRTTLTFATEVMRSVLKTTDRPERMDETIATLQKRCALYDTDRTITDEDLRLALAIYLIGLLSVRTVMQIIPGRGEEITPDLMRRSLQRTIAVKAFGATFAPSEDSWADDGRLATDLIGVAMDFLGRVLPTVIRGRAIADGRAHVWILTGLTLAAVEITTRGKTFAPEERTTLADLLRDETMREETPRAPIKVNCPPPPKGTFC